MSTGGKDRKVNRRSRAAKALTIFLGLGFLVSAHPSVAWEGAGPSPAPMLRVDKVPAASKRRLLESFVKLPLSFEANRGQVGGGVKFLARGGGLSMFLNADEAVLVLHQRESSAGARGGAIPSGSAVLRMKLAGANPTARVAGLEELPGKVNYFIGNDPSKWRTNIPTYGRVRYESVYPGVDLVYYGNQRQLEHDFVVAPGGDPSVIRLGFAGAEKLRVDGG